MARVVGTSGNTVHRVQGVTDVLNLPESERKRVKTTEQIIGPSMRFSADLSGYADGCEGVGPTCEERPPTDQQNTDVVLTLLLETKVKCQPLFERPHISVSFDAAHNLGLPLALTRMSLVLVRCPRCRLEEQDTYKVLNSRTLFVGSHICLFVYLFIFLL